jgi:hypothetical protein
MSVPSTLGYNINKNQSIAEMIQEDSRVIGELNNQIQKNNELLKNANENVINAKLHSGEITMGSSLDIINKDFSLIEKYVDKMKNKYDSMFEIYANNQQLTVPMETARQDHKLRLANTLGRAQELQQMLAQAKLLPSSALTPPPSGVPDLDKIPLADKVLVSGAHVKGAFQNGTKFYIMAELKTGTKLETAVQKVLRNKGLPPKQLHMTLLELETNNDHKPFGVTTGNSSAKWKHLGSSDFCTQILNSANTRNRDTLKGAFNQKINQLTLSLSSDKIEALPYGGEKFVSLLYDPPSTFDITGFRKTFYKMISDHLNFDVAKLGQNAENDGYVYFGDKNISDTDPVTVREKCLYAVRKFYFGKGVIKPHISIFDGSKLAPAAVKGKKNDIMQEINNEILQDNTVFNIEPNNFEKLQINLGKSNTGCNITINL